MVGSPPPRNSDALGCRHKRARHSVAPLLSVLQLLVLALSPVSAWAQSFSVSNVTKNSATLSVQTGNLFWSYKRTAPNSTSCAWKSSSSPAHLSGLGSNQQYTYKAWFGSDNCSGGGIQRTVTFTTKPSEPNAPSKPTVTKGTQQVSLQWTVPNDGGRSISKFQYTKKVGNNPFESTWTDICQTANDSSCEAQTSYTVTGLAGGLAHQFKVRANNSVGNGTASPASDAITPDGTVGLSVSDIRLTEATLTFSGYAGAWWYRGNQIGASCKGVPANTSTTNLTGLSPSSTYTYKVFLYDDCSDGLDIGSAKFTTLGPLGFGGVNITDKHFAVNKPITEEALPAAVGGVGQLTYSLMPTIPQGLSFDPSSRALSGTPTAISARTEFTYIVTDSEGTTAEAPFYITVEANAVPTFGAAAIKDLQFTQDQEVEIPALPAASGGNGTLRYTLTPSLPPGMRFDPATRIISGAPSSESARSLYTYTVTDADRETDQLTFGITVVGDIPPTFGSAVIDDVNMTQYRSFEAQEFPRASGGNGTLIYSVSPTLPAGVVFDPTTRILSGTPTVAYGRSWYTYQAADEQGDTSQLPFALTIAPNRLPSFEGLAIAEQLYQENLPIESLTLPEASGGDGALSYSVTPALPQGLSFNPTTRVLSGTPTEVSDRTEFSYEATDEEGDAAKLPLFITVSEDIAPDFEGVTVGEQIFKQNRDIGQVALPEAGGGNGELQYTLTPDLPRGLVFDAVTRTLSGIPTRVLDRAEFTYTATDEDGDTGQLPLYITVKADLMPDFEGVAIPEYEFKQSSDIGQVVLPAANGGDGQLTYLISPDLPDGLTLDASTHTLSGTPTAASARFKYIYSVADEDGDAAYLAVYITVEADSAPDFEGAAVAGLVFKQNKAIESVTLPEATGGDGDLRYTLSPALPEGLTLDVVSRILSGTPTVALDRTEFTYMVTDEDGDTDRLQFHITVEADLIPDFEGATIAEQLYKQNTPIEVLTLPGASGGDGSLTYTISPALPQGLTFDAATRVVAGMPSAAQARTEFTYKVTDEDGDAAQLTFYVEVEADLAPSFEGQSIADLRLGRGRAMEPVTLPTATGGDGAIAYVLAPELPNGLSYNAGTRTISGTPNELGGPWTFTFTATDADVVGPDAVSLRFSISVVILEEDKTVLSDILSAQGRALLNGATTAIGRRFSGVSGASNNQSSALNRLGSWLANAYSHSGGMGMAPMAGGMHMMSGPGNAGTFGPSVGMMHNSAGLNGIGGMGRGAAWHHLLQDQSFTLSANTTGHSRMQLMRFTVWSAVDYQSFSGASETNDYEGGMASIYLGGDVQFNANWLAGAALSSNSGTSDYTVTGRSGELKTSLISVYPYVHGRTGSGMELWFIGGFGSGEAEDLSQHAGATAEASDLSMTMGAAGIRQPVSQISGMDLSIVGGVGILSLTTNDGQNAIDGLDAGVSQARVGAEIGRNTASMSPYLRLSGRYDGGGSQSGGGLEVVGGLRYASDKIDFEAQGRWLAVHSAADYQEFGGMARLLYKSRADGTGLQMSVQPGWGEANGGALFGRNGALLGGSDLRTMLPVGSESNMQPLVLDNDLAYGFTLGQGLLTVGARQFRYGDSVRESVGLAWKVVNLSPVADRSSNNLALRLDYERPQPYLSGGLRVELQYALRL